MSKTSDKGVFQLDNGYWGYRYIIKVDGKNKESKRTRDDFGNPFKTKAAASKARQQAIVNEKIKMTIPKQIKRRTVEEVYQEYCEYGRNGKAYSTIVKQDSLWKNHIKKAFGKRDISEISVAEIQDYLAKLYYEEGRAYKYVESFLKMFYLIFGQAYSRDYISVDQYNKLCLNRDTKIHMPKLKIDDDQDIVVFDKDEMRLLDEYFSGTNAETAYMLGKYCGLRINECYGLKWENVDFENGCIRIEQQMQYQDGLIKLVSLKTRNAKRTIYMSHALQDYMSKKYDEWIIDSKQCSEQREQNKKMIRDVSGNEVSSLCLVNTLRDGKIQTINSMKYHTKKIKQELGIVFKYHYLRHTFGKNLANMNTPMNLLCNQMGHGNSNVTQKYYIAMSVSGVEILKGNLNML